MQNTIAFPGPGLSFEINRVAFTVLGRPIYWYALCILTGLLLGMMFVLATSKKRGVEPDHVFDICFWGIISSIVCARIYYCIFDWESIGGFSGIFKIWEGGIAIYGAIIGAILSTAIYCKIKKLNWKNVFDVCCPGLFIGQIIGRWGNFFNAEVYGKETSSFFRMTINGGDGVHPLFLYESIWNLIGLLLLIAFRHKKKADGQVFCFYIFWYSLGRLFLEGMRQSEYILYLIPNTLGISQVVAAIGIIVGAAGKVYLGVKAKKQAAMKVELKEESKEAEKAETEEIAIKVEEAAKTDEIAEVEAIKETAAEEATETAVEKADEDATEEVAEAIVENKGKAENEKE